MAEMTPPRRRWARAGVRLTDAEARRVDARRARSRHAAAAAEQEAYRQWDAGLLVPARITTALDLRGLAGPGVDAACDAAEPDVDRWEAGELYPTWNQLRLLARLTELPLRFFFLPPARPEWTTLDFHLPAPPPRHPPIDRFAPTARDAKSTPIQGRLL